MARKINYIIVHRHAGGQEGDERGDNEVAQGTRQALTHDLAALVGLYVEIAS